MYVMNPIFHTCTIYTIRLLSWTISSASIITSDACKIMNDIIACSIASFINPAAAYNLPSSVTSLTRLLLFSFPLFAELIHYVTACQMLQISSLLCRSTGAKLVFLVIHVAQYYTPAWQWFLVLARACSELLYASLQVDYTAHAGFLCIIVCRSKLFHSLPASIKQCYVPCVLCTSAWILYIHVTTVTNAAIVLWWITIL